MSKICYVERKFQAASREIIERAEGICQDYAAQGYDLTLRQLYYQFVSRDWLPNSQLAYDRLGSVINDARLAGLIDWDHLVDRTRNLASLGTWRNPQQILNAVASQYREDKWLVQPQYVEVWVEKEALAGVIQRPAERWQVPYFSCRGYVSQSEMHSAAQRLQYHVGRGQAVTILHLGDHDPSGLDMTRDIRDRMAIFGTRVQVERLALNMDQVEAYNPPPNPAKLTDARGAGYVELYGPSSWELDALDPATLDALIDGAIREHLDMGIWEASITTEADQAEGLQHTARHWDRVKPYAERVAAGHYLDEDDDE